MNNEALKITDLDPKLLTALATIQQPLIIVTSDPALPEGLITSGVRKSVADDALKHWDFAFHYILYRWTNRKYKIPGYRKMKSNERKALNAWGEYVYATLNLLIQCHPRLKKEEGENPYTDAFEWFGKMMSNKKAINISMIFSPNGLECKNNEEYKQGQLILESLRSYINPIPIELAEKYLHDYRMFETSIFTANIFDEFRQKWWMPYIRAYAALNREIRNGTYWKSLYRKTDAAGQDKYFCRLGRGNREVELKG
ncbi:MULTISPECIES: hypothetical protein [Cyanophyceae]|uniref:hypothetical protein n=1 Tax=Cyanophyceae TaxID=3028117 RepID=UPI001682295C|nr:hypothetical protein [Trichocoleus sp. FACHB-40]MBD2006979.1 hypothetical protein [Trichocoleus sp. FACHB-40]